MNLHEFRNRGTLVGKLLGLVELIARGTDTDDAEVIAAWLERMSDKEWRDLAKVSDCSKPGPKSRELLISLIRARGRELALPSVPVIVGPPLRAEIGPCVPHEAIYEDT